MHSETIYGDEKFRHSLKHFGVAHISDGIPLKYVHAALMLINKRIGEMKFFAAHGTHDKLQRDGEPSSDPEILDLFNKSFLKHIFEHLTGPRKDKYEQVLGQLTPRFPGDFCGKDRNWHIDYVDVYNAARKTELPVVPNFDALIAILLTDSHGEASGELCTFPSSHRSLSGYFVKNPGEFEKLHQLGGDAGYPRNTGHGNNKQDEVLGKDVYHCMGKAGDVFILNYMNAHYVTCNSSPYIRNNIYFRVWGNTFADHCREERNHGVDTRTGCGNRTSMLDPLVHWHL